MWLIVVRFADTDSLFCIRNLNGLRSESFDSRRRRAAAGRLAPLPCALAPADAAPAICLPFVSFYVRRRTHGVVARGFYAGAPGRG
jgi:hypothetical protein